MPWLPGVGEEDGDTRKRVSYAGTEGCLGCLGGTVIGLLKIAALLSSSSS